MESYSALRQFADSWGLLLIVAAFVAMLVWVFRPGARKQQEDAANMIFRNEDRPKDEPGKDDEDGR
jgi:cytochrome c oxidase cbb3-type subunit IV